MTEKNLTDLLAGAAERVPVGPLPWDSITRRAARTRRTRRLRATVGSAAAVATVITGAVVLAPDRAGAPEKPDTPPSFAVPPGMRLVGLGQAAILVPETWGTNETECGSPVKDTVIIDVGATPACGLLSTTPGIDSVELTQGPRPFDFKADSTTTVDGVEAERQSTSCEQPTQEPGRARQPETCFGALYLPSIGVGFRAVSSTSASTVNEILDRVRIVPGQVGVPGFQTYALDDQGRSGQTYAAALRADGLAVAVRTEKRPATTPGYVLSADPAPGTMLRPGDTVTITQVAEPEGPADEVEVAMNSVGSDNEYVGLEDPQIRAGGTLRLQVGDSLWAYASGKRSSTLAAVLKGGTLDREGAPGDTNFPNTWKAARPGTTTVTLTITADGEPVTLGTVTVIVR